MAQKSVSSRPTSGSDGSAPAAEGATSHRPDRSDDDAAPAAAHHAWAVSSGWCGPPELLARIATVAIEAVEKLENRRPHSAVEVTVPVAGEATGSRGDAIDVERFESPESFIDRVTADGLRKFARIDISVHGRSTRVRVSIVRMQGFQLRRISRAAFVRQWPPDEGVFLDVISSDPNAFGVSDVRDRVLTAIQRGRSNWRHVTSSTGGRTPYGTTSAFRTRDDPREAIAMRSMLGILVLFAVVDWLGWAGTDRALLQLGVAVVFGLILSASAFLLLPVVEVSAETRIGQAGRTLARVGLLAAGPAIGLLLNEFVKPHL